MGFLRTVTIAPAAQDQQATVRPAGTARNLACLAGVRLRLAGDLQAGVTGRSTVPPGRLIHVGDGPHCPRKFHPARRPA